MLVFVLRARARKTVDFMELCRFYGHDEQGRRLIDAKVFPVRLRWPETDLAVGARDSAQTGSGQWRGSASPGIRDTHFPTRIPHLFLPYRTFVHKSTIP
jgi:hypothetical protein